MLNKKILISILIFVLIIILIIGIIDWWVVNHLTKNSVTQHAQAAKLDIMTDKAEYQQGETVKIMISNYADNPIVQEMTSEVDIKAINYLGENYGVGLIEKYNQDAWNAIEPVWRCSNSCFLPCEEQHSINSGERKVFTWDQSIIICDYFNKTEERVKAGLGRYRISSGFWNEDKQRSEIIYSNEFIIR